MIQVKVPMAYGRRRGEGNSEEVCTTLHCGEEVIEDREDAYEETNLAEATFF